MSSSTPSTETSSSSSSPSTSPPSTLSSPPTSSSSSPSPSPSPSNPSNPSNLSLPSSSPFPLDDRKSFITNSPLVDVRIHRIRPLLPPACLLEEMPLSSTASQFIYLSRKSIVDVIHHRDDRLVVVVGPCSIHDVKAAKEYATKLQSVMGEFSSSLLILMRVYFEKPRTTVGWKGSINDPHLDGSYQINVGLRVARGLIVDINNMNIPVATEFLDTISPEYISDGVSWGAIGARTTESQLHREMVSGLSCPMGFKNGTTGNTKIAIDAIVAAASPHAFLGVTWTGVAGIIETKGNDDCHIVLRGSDTGPNYTPFHIQETTSLLEKYHCSLSIMVDCSHGNSSKKHENQCEVVSHIASQLSNGNDNIIGVMIESNLVSGNQQLKSGMKLGDLKYGQSITDACIDFETTVGLLKMLAQAVEGRRKKKKEREEKQKEKEKSGK